jgi:hypothetical protein
MELVINGRQKKSLIVENSTVKIIKASGFIASKREKTIPIRNITSVEVKKPGAMFVGFIQFSIAGGQARDSSFTISGGAVDAVLDENSVVFADQSSYQTALKIKEYVENYTEHSPVAVQQQSDADEIRKLKTLLDEGILTEDEFSEKKRRILGI